VLDTILAAAPGIAVYQTKQDVYDAPSGIVAELAHPGSGVRRRGWEGMGGDGTVSVAVAANSFEVRMPARGIPRTYAVERE